MEKALERARLGRLHILDIMDQTISSPREEISAYAPRIVTIQVPVEKIGAIIGPGGKTIKKIIEETGVKIDIDDEGKTVIASEDMSRVEQARKIILSMAKDPDIGDYFKGTVKKVTNFGAFVEIVPGKEGMVHISELDLARTNKVTDVVNVGDKIDVLVKRIDPEGKIALSRKDYLRKNAPKEEAPKNE
jgi:polyribonucleotide nucleotidyltransferase